MALDPQKIAEAMGAVHLGQVPDVGGGAFGAARLAALLKERLEPSPDRRPGQPTNVRWIVRPRVPMSRETEQKLIVLAERLSSPERRLSPMQVAAQLLEDAVSAALQEK